MDTTYFGRRFGIMVLFDSISRKALSVTEVKTETNTLYVQEIGSLKNQNAENGFPCPASNLSRYGVENGRNRRIMHTAARSCLKSADKIRRDP